MMVLVQQQTEELYSEELWNYQAAGVNNVTLTTDLHWKKNCLSQGLSWFVCQIVKFRNAILCFCSLIQYCSLEDFFNLFFKITRFLEHRMSTRGKKSWPEGYRIWENITTSSLGKSVIMRSTQIPMDLLSEGQRSAECCSLQKKQCLCSFVKLLDYHLIAALWMIAFLKTKHITTCCVSVTYIYFVSWWSDAAPSHSFKPHSKMPCI